MLTRWRCAQCWTRCVLSQQHQTASGAIVANMKSLLCPVSGFVFRTRCVTDILVTANENPSVFSPADSALPLIFPSDFQTTHHSYHRSNPSALPACSSSPLFCVIFLQQLFRIFIVRLSISVACSCILVADHFYFSQQIILIYLLVVITVLPLWQCGTVCVPLAFSSSGSREEAPAPSLLTPGTAARPGLTLSDPPAGAWCSVGAGAHRAGGCSKRRKMKERGSEGSAEGPFCFCLESVSSFSSVLTFSCRVAEATLCWWFMFGTRKIRLHLN